MEQLPTGCHNHSVWDEIKDCSISSSRVLHYKMIFEWWVDNIFLIVEDDGNIFVVQAVKRALFCGCFSSAGYYLSRAVANAVEGVYETVQASSR